MLGIATLIILYLRLSIPGPATPFSTADNPTAKASSIMTRFYTFLYLPVFNFFLLIHPQTLSFDWSMDSIPRIETLFDQRNIFSLIFYSLTLRLIFVCIMNTIHMPESISSRSSNISGKRVTKFSARKRQQQHHNDNKISDENKCSVCSVYHGNQKHSNVCNNVTISEHDEQTHVNTSIKSMISLSPLRKYIRSSNQNFNAATTVNNNDDNNNNFLDKDNNNNNIVNENENSNADNVPDEQVKISLSHINSNKKIVTKFKPTKDNEHIEKVYLTDVICSNNEVQTKVNRTTAALLSVTILILPFMPASNIFFYVGFVIGERILYLPSVGFCLLIGLGLERILNIKSRFQELKGNNRTTQGIRQFLHHHMKTIIFSIFTTILISMSIRTVKRNLDWRNEESLYQSAVCVNPPKGKMFNLIK